MNTPDKPKWLRDLVRTFCISFRLRPMYVSLVGDRPEIGFELELIGTHPAAGPHIGERCAHCLRVLMALLELADRGLGDRQEIARPLSAHCEKWLRYTANRASSPEVVLRVTVVRPMTLEEIEEDRMLELADDVRKVLDGLGCREVPFSAVPPLDRYDSLAQEVMAA